MGDSGVTQIQPKLHCCNAFRISSASTDQALPHYRASEDPRMDVPKLFTGLIGYVGHASHTSR